MVEPAGTEEPCWTGVSPDGLSDTDVTNIFNRVTRLSPPGRRTNNGVTTMDVTPASTHPWRLYTLRQRDRRVARRAVCFYRRRVGQLIEQDGEVVRVLGSGVCSRLRHALELVDGPNDGSVATRVRVSHGLTMPRLLPSRKAYTARKRNGIESEVVSKHWLWTLDDRGEVDAWSYVSGSAASGERRYTTPDGRERRLGSSGTKRSAFAFVFDKSSSGPTAGPASMADQDASLADDLQAASTSFLESSDGRDRTTVVALEFDGPGLIQKALEDGRDLSYKTDPQLAVNVLTVAADGGPVCRRTLTVVTVTLSSELLVGDQSPLLPMVYLLSGEGIMHSGVGRRLRRAIEAVLNGRYCVPYNAAEEATSSMLPLKMHSSLHLCADFAMQDHFLALTGGADEWRCPSGYPCPTKDMNSPSAASLALSRPRTIDMIEQQWRLSTWTFSRWCALRSRLWVAKEGVVGVPCRRCKQVMSYETIDATHLACRREQCLLFGALQGEVLPPLPKSAMGVAYRAARRVFGGVRGFPVVPNTPIVVQNPVLHCTSAIVRAIIFFLLAWLNRRDADAARLRIHKVEGKTNMGAMYGREFRDLVAKLLACPTILGVEIDNAIMKMLALAQILCASWRKAVGRGTMAQREAAAAILELSAMLLAPLFAVLKPLDPDTKNRGVQNLYLHAAVAHARRISGINAPPVPLVSDDDIEGIIRLLNVYFRTRTSNISRVEALTDMHAIGSFVTGPQASRFSAEAGIYTSSIRVCHCYTTLGASMKDDLQAAHDMAATDVELSCNTSAGSNGTNVTTFCLPSSLRETEESIVASVERGDDEGVIRLGMERRVALSLVQRQAVVDVCFCGNLGGSSSPMADVLMTTLAGAPVSNDHCGSESAPSPPLPSTSPLDGEPFALQGGPPPPPRSNRPTPPPPPPPPPPARSWRRRRFIMLPHHSRTRHARLLLFWTRCARSLVRFPTFCRLVF